MVFDSGNQVLQIEFKLSAPTSLYVGEGVGGRHIYSKSYKPPQNFRRQKSGKKQFHTGPTNIKRHCTKFSRHGDLAPGICAPLLHVISF